MSTQTLGEGHWPPAVPNVADARPADPATHPRVGPGGHPSTPTAVLVLRAADLREQRVNAAPPRPMRVGPNIDLVAQYIAAETNPDFARVGIRRWRQTVDWHRPDDDDPSICSRCTRSEDGVVTGGYSWPCPDLQGVADEAKAYLGGAP